MNHVTKCAEALRERFHIRTNPEYPGQVSYAATTEEVEAVIRPYLTLEVLTEDERMDIFNKYCTYCGSDNPQCQCWNDE